MTRRLVLLAVLLTACTPTPPVTYPTPSGEPEVTILAPKAAVRDSLAAFLVGQRFVITKADDYNLAASIRLLETPLPVLTLSYSLVPVSGGTRVIGHAVQFNQSGAEDVTHTETGKMAQLSLEAVAHSFVR